MTSKERVLRALAHEKPDRVPINYFANPGIDSRLKSHFGLDVKDGEGLAQALGVDFRGVHASYKGPKLHPDISERGIIADDWGIRRRWVQHGTGGYWDYCDFPLRDADRETILKWPMPNPDHYEYAAVKAACEAQRKYCVFTGGAGLPDIINSTGMIRTMEQVLVDLALDDEAGLAYIDKKIEILYEITARTLEAAGGGINLLWLGEDLGTQIGPMISLDLFRKHIRPRHQRFVDLGKAFNLPVMIHSCGSSSWAFDDFIEMGIDGVETLQPEAKNMAPTYLKERYGVSLAFHGCISTAGPVATGTERETVKYCREILEIMMPGAGYCFAPTHALQDNSPTENVVAMYTVAQEEGGY